MHNFYCFIHSDESSRALKIPNFNTLKTPISRFLLNVTYGFRSHVDHLYDFYSFFYRRRCFVHYYSSVTAYGPSRDFFFVFPHHLSPLLPSPLPVAFQVVVIYDNIRIVSRVQSRLVFREMESSFFSLSRSVSFSFFLVLSCHTSK